MIKIINKKEMYKNILQAIKNEYSVKNLPKINIFNKNVYFNVIELVENNKVIDKIVLDEDKKNVMVSFFYDTIRFRYSIKLSRFIDEEYEIIANILIRGDSIDTVCEHLNNGDFYISVCICPIEDNEQILKFYRNNISKFPESNIVSQKYNKIKNVIRSSRYINDSLCLTPFNYLELNHEINDDTTIDSFFVKNLLKNSVYSSDDESFFENILNLNEYDTKIEIIWTYFRKGLANFGVFTKKELCLFYDYIDDIRKKLHPLEFNECYDYTNSVIYLYFKTGLEKPYNDVIVVVKKDEDIEKILNKNLRSYILKANKQYTEIGGVSLKDFLNNKQEIIELIKLIGY